MTNFTYNRDMPNPPNDPGDDAPKMKTNTNSTDDLIAVDHISFGVNNGGYHKQMHLFNQAAPGLGGADGVMYAALNNSGLNGQQSFPVWQNALGNFLMFNYQTSDTANGFVSLPGGILLQWGVKAGSNLASNPVVFPTQFLKAGVATAPYTVQVIPERAATSPGPDFATVIVTGSITSTGFTIGNIGAHTIVNWYWLAIGPLN